MTMSSVPVGVVPDGTTTVVVAMKLNGVPKFWPYIVKRASAPSSLTTSPVLFVIAGIGGTWPNFCAPSPDAIVVVLGAR